MKNKHWLTKFNSSLLRVLLFVSIPWTVNGQPPNNAHVHVQHAQAFLNPHVNNPQGYQVNVIRGNTVTKEMVTNLQSYSLAAGANVAIIERGDKIKSLPAEVMHVGSGDISIKKYLLPETYISRLRNGTTAFLEIIMICQSKLIMDRSDSRYHGLLTFQLINTQQGAGTEEQLAEPVNLTLFSKSLDSFEPGTVSFDRTNAIVQINCAGRKQLEDSAEVNIVTPIKQGGYKYYMEVEPFLEMNLTKNSIKGLGIQDALVSVTYHGSTRNDSVKVMLDVTKGAVKPSTLFVKFNEPAEFKVRSESIGIAEIVATSKFDPLKVPIRYSFPWLYLILPLLGGAVGAFAKTYDSQDEKPIKVGKLLAGALLGLIGAIAWYVLGINLAGIEWKAEFNELAAVGIGAVITLLGIKK